MNEREEQLAKTLIEELEHHRSQVRINRVLYHLIRHYFPDAAVKMQRILGIQ